MSRMSEIAQIQDLIADRPLDLQDDDYRLIDGAAWFSVKNIAIRIHQTDEGVVVDLYPNGYETNHPLASAYAFFDEAANEIQETAKAEQAA